MEKTAQFSMVLHAGDVNKAWTHKDQNKDKDKASKSRIKPCPCTRIC